MNSYRNFIDSQERSCMTEDEKLEKKNSEILTLYITANNNIFPENVTSQVETVNIEPEKNTKKRCK